MNSFYTLNIEYCQKYPQDDTWDSCYLYIPRKKYLAFRRAQLKATMKGDKKFSENDKSFKRGRKTREKKKIGV